MPKQKPASSSRASAAPPAAPVARVRSGGARQRLVKHQLAEAAIELFTAKGFDAVTVNEIVDKVGIARRTFFLYFATKEDALIQWLDDEWDRATQNLLTHHASKPPFEAYAGALLELGLHFELDRERAMAITRVTLDNPSVFGRQYANQFSWQSRWATRLREVQGKRRDQALTYEVQAAAIFALVAVCARRWLDDPKKRSFCSWLERGFEELRSLSRGDATPTVSRRA